MLCIIDALTSSLPFEALILQTISCPFGGQISDGVMPLGPKDDIVQPNKMFTYLESNGYIVEKTFAFELGGLGSQSESSALLIDELPLSFTSGYYELARV